MVFMSHDEAAHVRAWVTMLLGLAGEAFSIGHAEVGGAVAADEALQPAVLLRGSDGAVLLAVDVYAAALSAAERAKRSRGFARAGVPEYWQIALRPRRAHFYQRNARGEYDLVPPDQAGIHYTLLAEEFAFPVQWLRELPGLFDMLQEWGLVDE
jgi:hypothetical protein